MKTSSDGITIMNDEKNKSRIFFCTTQARENFSCYQHEEKNYNYGLSSIYANTDSSQFFILNQCIDTKITAEKQGYEVSLKKGLFYV